MFSKVKGSVGGFGEEWGSFVKNGDVKWSKGMETNKNLGVISMLMNGEGKGSKRKQREGG